MSGEKNVHRKLATMNLQKFHELYYQKGQQIRQRNTILRTLTQNCIYYSTYTSKLVNVLHDDCQLVVVQQKDGYFEIGYTLNTEGFPHTDYLGAKPCFEKTISMDGVQQIGMDGPYFCIKLKKQDKLWKFKLERNDLITKWITLIFCLNERMLKKKNEFAQNKLHVFKVDVKNKKHTDQSLITTTQMDRLVRDSFDETSQTVACKEEEKTNSKEGMSSKQWMLKWQEKDKQCCDLKKAVDQLAQSNQRFDLQMKQLKKTLCEQSKQIQFQNSDYAKHYSHNHNQLTAALQKNEALSQQILELKRQKDKLKTQISINLTTKEDQIDRLRKQLNQKQNSPVDTHIHSRKQLRTEGKQTFYQNQVAQLQQQNQQLKIKNASLDQSNKMMQKQLLSSNTNRTGQLQMQKTINDFQSKYQQVEKQSAQLRSQNQQLTKLFNETQESNAQLTFKLEQAELIASQKHQDLTNCQNQINKLNRDLNAAQQSINFMIKPETYQHLKQLNDSLEYQLDQKNKELEQKTCRSYSSSEESTRQLQFIKEQMLQQKNKEVQQKKTQFEREKLLLQSKFQQEKTTLNNTIAQQKQNTRNKVNECEALKKQILHKASENKQLEDKLSVAMRQNNQLQAELEKQKDKSSSKLDEMGVISQEKDSLQSAFQKQKHILLNNCQLKQKQVSSLNQKIQNMEQQHAETLKQLLHNQELFKNQNNRVNAELKSQNRKLGDKVKSLEQEKQSSFEQQERKNNQISHLAQQLDVLKDESMQKRRQFLQKTEELQQKSVDFNALEDKYQKMEQNWNKLQQSHQALLTQNQNQAEEKQKGGNLLQQVNKKCQDLEKRIKDITTESEEKQQQLKEQLNRKQKQFTQMQQQWNDQKAKYERTIQDYEEDKKNKEKQLEEKKTEVETLIKQLQKIKEQDSQVEYLKKQINIMKGKMEQVREKQCRYRQKETQFYRMEIQLQENQREIKNLQNQVAESSCSSLFYGKLLDNLDDYKLFLKRQVQSTRKREILKTFLIFSLDPLNSSSFHKYIDEVPDIVLVVKTEIGMFFGGYSEAPVSSSKAANKSGILFSLTNKMTFPVIPSKRTLTYDTYFFIFGNSEIRLKQGEFKVFCNFGIANGFYNPKGANINDLLGEGKDREVKILAYEIHKVLFR